MRRMMVRSLVGLAVLGLALGGYWQATRAAAPEADPRVERTRKQVKMLDDVYKTAVVLITTHYVNKDTDLPAGAAAKALFAEVKKKGWHEVRLLDVTGEPYNAQNKAGDDFEKAAVKAMKEGKDWYEQVVEKDNKKYLRAATPVPVVMKKCTMCHPGYEKAKAGEAIGTLSYTVPLVD